MSKKRKKRGLLHSQRPKRRWSLLSRVWKPFLFGFVAMSFGLALVWSVRYLASEHGLFYRSDERPQLAIITGLTPEEQARVLKAYQQLPAVTPKVMKGLAIELHQQMGLRRIDLIQTAPNRVAIATHPFIASLVVELDRLRFVTEDGIVFGQLTPEEAATLPVLRGLDRKAPLIRTANGTFVPSAGQQRPIEEALLAIKEGKDYNITYRTLTYDDFRGLSGELVEPSYRITLGFRPFESKYLKLDKILTSLKQRGLTSATIELDYKGKAFVKESVL
jgi:hypothetical protein